MFEKIAKRFQTVVLVILVFMLSAVFVLEFGGPQSQGCASGGATYAARVYGNVITEGDFRASYTLGGFDRRPAASQRSMRLKEHVLDGLVERSLLARQAEDLGYRVDAKEVMTRLLEDGTVYLSLGVAAPPYLPQGEIAVTGPGSDFDKEAAKRFIQYHLRRSVSEFTEAQVTEALAERMRDTVRASVTVSPREVWDAFVEEQDQVRIEYVRFSPGHYKTSIEPTDAKVEAWMAEHQDEVDQEYQANKHRYTGLEKQARARHILIRASEEASEEEKGAARARAAQLLARVKAGEDFAALAKEHSDDPGSAAKGGDLGWNPRGRMVEAFDEAMFALEPGSVSDVVETRFGYHVIKLEGFREGDVPEQEAKRELAERLYVDGRAEEMARQASKKALAKWKEGLSRDELDAFLAGRAAGGGKAAAPGGDATEGDAGSADSEESEESEDDDPLRPRVRDSGSFGRADNPISGPFDASPLVREAFERSLEEPFPDAPLELGSELVIFKVVERQEASRENFTDEERRRLGQRLRAVKEDETLRIYVERLREQAEADGAVRINEDILTYGEEAQGGGGRAPVGAGL